MIRSRKAQNSSPAGYWHSRRTPIYLALALILSACGGSQVVDTSPVDERPIDASSSVTGAPDYESVTASPVLPPVESATSFAQSGCIPSPIEEPSQFEGLFEVQGTSSGSELWALIFQSPQSPLRVMDRIKIVWRMTGSGDLSLVAFHEDGASVEPHEGPSKHEGSTWNRPGSEWGSGFEFSEPGCWRIIATRGSEKGYIELLIEP